jgi:hypothetical protein
LIVHASAPSIARFSSVITVTSMSLTSLASWTPETILSIAAGSTSAIGKSWPSRDPGPITSTSSS